MQLIVLGMHRSGTSLLACLLEAMGCHVGFPEELLEANSANPRGFWERRDVVELNDGVLRALGHDWKHAAPIDGTRLGAKQRNRFEKAGRSIVGKLDRHRPWALKDPRMSLLFPLWRPLLERPVGVIVYRSPIEVARSLHQREGMMAPFSIALWEAYNLSILKSTQGLARVLVCYRDLVMDPVAAVVRLRRELAALEVGDLVETGSDEIRSAVDPDLYRQRAEPDLERDFLTPPQASLLEILASGQALNLDRVPELSAASREVMAGVEELGARIVHREQELRAKDKALRNAASLRADLHSSVTAFQQRLADGQEDLARHREALAVARDDFQKTREALRAERRHFAEQLAHLERALAARDQTLAAYRGSAEAFTERVRGLEEDLKSHRGALDQARSDFRAAERTLREEREERAREVELRDHALKAKDRILEEFAKSAEELRRLLRARETDLEVHRDALEARERTLEDFAESVAEFERRLASNEADLDSHRTALARAVEDYQKLEASLREERLRQAREISARDDQRAELERRLDDALRAVESRGSRLAELRTVAESLRREALALGSRLEETHNELRQLRGSFGVKILRRARLLR